jgi:hypothetical protein
MTSSLRLVSERFPDLRERVACLYETDETFRELCEDYATCAEALARQKACEGLRQEYAALRLRLETELLRYVQEDADSTRRK